MSALIECGACKGEGYEPDDAFRICGHCVGAGQLTESGHTSRTVLQAMDYAASEIGGNGYDIVMEARAAVAELVVQARLAQSALAVITEPVRLSADAVSALQNRASKLDAALARVQGAGA